jgi:HAD superfamily hydrolase (TIGR01509 family)
VVTAPDQLPPPGAVLFDLDGTLVDTVAMRIAAWQLALAAARLTTPRDSLASLIGLDGRRLAHEIAARVGRPIDVGAAEVIDRQSGEIYARLNHSPQPLPGVDRLTIELDRRGIPWAIATSSRKEQVAVSVAALGLVRKPIIVDASHVKHAKPAPDLLLLAARHLRVKPGVCWYVGDSTWDMIAAVAAGMFAIGVTAGSAVDATTLASAGAAAVVDTLMDVAAMLDSR